MALHNRRDRNREAIERFANSFDPPLAFNKTEAIGGARVTNGWVAAYHDPDTELGVTAVAFGAGQFKCWLEALGTDSDADELGLIMAGLVQQLRPELEEVEVAAEPEPELEERRQPQDAGLISDRMQFKRAMFGEFPNLHLVDMAELTPQERHALVTKFPELRFVYTQHGRFRLEGTNAVQDDRAGYCTEEQLAAVRAPKVSAVLEAQGQRSSRLAPRKPIAATSGGVALSAATEAPVASGEPLPIMGPAPKEGCEHNWARNSIGDGATCSKCGGFERRRNTRERSATENAERKLRDLEESRQAACDRGEHEFVAPSGDEYGVCVYCGAEEPRPEQGG
jgi:hypothetical protein